MKTTCLLFLTMSWAALTQPPGYAVPSSSAPQPTSPAASANTASGHPRDAAHSTPADHGRNPTGGKAPDEQRGHDRASGPNHPPSRASLTKANRPMRLPNGGQRPIPRNGMNLYQPASNISAGTAKGGFIQNQTVNNALALRTPTFVRPTGPLLNNMPHRSPNPAVIGGSPNLHRSDTGRINGTRMNRKP